jgi:NADH-ubiquinone oxidoreductase chain 6
MKDILLNLLALGAILSSVLVITSKNPVISVLYLISVFINTAGYLILLGIGFVGIAYIIVYIGAITVLFLFVIMMINIKLVDILEVGREYTKNLPLALSIGFVFLYEILSITTIGGGADPAVGLLAEGPVGLNPISLQFLTYPLELLTNLNKLFISPMDLLLSGQVQSVTESINTVNTVLNPNALDTSFINFLQIEMLGQGLYTYGAV